MTNNHAGMTAEGVLDVHLGCPFYITVANLGKTNMSLTKHQKVAEVENEARKIFHIEEKRF